MFFDDAPEVLEVNVGGQVYSVRRARLRQYFILEQLRRVKNVRKYLECCQVQVPEDGLDALSLFGEIVKYNMPNKKFPFTETTDGKKEDIPWDYDDRWVIAWVHVIAHSYHWSLAEILSLSVEEFYAFLQEAMVEDQFDREWEYSLSETAYEYDPNAKVSRLRPLKRPGWMQRKINPKMVRLKVDPSMLPQGLVIDLSVSKPT